MWKNPARKGRSCKGTKADPPGKADSREELMTSLLITVGIIDALPLVIAGAGQLLISGGQVLTVNAAGAPPGESPRLV